VETQFIKKDKKYPTAYSVILSAPIGERTVLIYRGACHFMELADVPWERFKKVKWFYLAPLSEKSTQLFGPLVKFAREHKIKVAANPGSGQLNLGEEVLKPILSQIDVLILNKEEAALLTKMPRENEKDLIKKLVQATGGVIVITKGREGSVVCDGKYVYSASAPSVFMAAPGSLRNSGGATGAGPDGTRPPLRAKPRHGSRAPTACGAVCPFGTADPPAQLSARVARPVETPPPSSAESALSSATGRHDYAGRIDGLPEASRRGQRLGFRRACLAYTRVAADPRWKTGKWYSPFSVAGRGDPGSRREPSDAAPAQLVFPPTRTRRTSSVSCQPARGNLTPVADAYSCRPSLYPSG